jgi:hypothetical protein
MSPSPLKLVVTVLVCVCIVVSKTYIVLCLCFVLFRLVYPKLSDYLDCHFWIALWYSLTFSYRRLTFFPNCIWTPTFSAKHNNLASVVWHTSLMLFHSVNRRRTDNTLARRRTVKGKRDKQRSSRIYEDTVSPSPLKLVVTVLKWNNIRLVCQTTLARFLCLVKNVWVQIQFEKKSQSSIAKR